MSVFLRKSCFILALVSISLLFGCTEKPVTSTVSKPTEGMGVVTIAAVGDIFLTDAMLADARMADGTYDFTAKLADTVNSLSAADVAIGNFEGNFAGEPFSGGSMPDSFASALGDIGFDLLQTANSFSIHNGIAGLQRTKAVIENEHMTALGTYTDYADREEHRVVIREINGIRIAFIAFTKGLNGMSLPSGSEYSVDLLYRDYNENYSDVDTEDIVSLLSAVQLREPDVIIAMLHWGSENITEISETQEEITALMLANGVDVIIGSHSHRVSTIEQRKFTMQDGREKTAVIAYSLGDFCAATEGDVNASLILNLEFTRNHATGATTLTDVSYTPLATVDFGAGRTDRYAVLNVDNAISLYEQNYFGRVSDEIYEELLAVQKDLLESTTPDAATPEA